MRRVLKIVGWCLVVLLLAPIVMVVTLYLCADMQEPPLEFNPEEYRVEHCSDTLVCQESYLRYDSCGLWELYVEGSDQVRGAKQGALTQDLMRYQEDVFIDKIHEIIPSDSYLGLLRCFLIIFNRNIGSFVPLEYRHEIVALSQFCTHEYDAIGSPYERQLNYHAAHDIGHTMQQYMLVGCSSFGAWGSKSDDRELIVGRNFDFYVGDRFADNKIITFAAPDRGYRYASVGWAGMVGVLSGMNERGLTVTINAAKGAIPTSAATPISILTREILQYASTVDEALKIAQSRETFVNESILVGSACDGRVALIEKSPEQTALYSSPEEYIVSTNHYQSDEFALDSYNIENIEDSDSQYRYDRLTELIDAHQSICYLDAASILRDHKGLSSEDIGLGNEMTLNQSIAHHSVIFKPESSLMWVTTSPWQSGRIVCYDLKGFFAGEGYPAREESMDVEPDSLFINRDYPRLLRFREMSKEVKLAMKCGEILGDDFVNQFIELNPHYYYTYRLLGDYYESISHEDGAKYMYSKALECAIPYKSERREIEEIIKKIEI